jgi:hypothetical protein
MFQKFQLELLEFFSSHDQSLPLGMAAAKPNIRRLCIIAVDARRCIANSQGQFDHHDQTF